MTRRAVAFALLVFLFPAVSHAYEVTPKGEQLAAMLDGMHVTRYWKPGQRVGWKTGKRNKKAPYVSTHCSAFAAAACYRSGVYLLRPPRHSQVLLANAQNRWLHREGAKHGWHRVKSGDEAQRLANEGYLVLATYRNSNGKKPGHIAVVRPSTKIAARITAEGPQITQAGRHNYRSTSLKNGFRSHGTAFEQGQIEFFAHRM